MGYLSHFPSTKSTVFSTSPDSYISASPKGELFASSIDFFYPLVDDAYLQGQITACNVLSDLYAAGVTNVDNFAVILGLSNKLTVEQRTEVAVDLMAGMESKIQEANTKISGGQTVINPWITVGGSVFGFFDHPDHIIENREAKPGDLIIVTKPIGNQLLVNFLQYFRKDAEKRQKLEQAGLTREKLDEISVKVFDSLSQLNLYGAKLMNKYSSSVKAATDITGFGIKGHSDNLVEMQDLEVDFLLETIPVFEGLKKYDKLVRNFKLDQGLSAETSGGLLIVIEQEKADEFLKEFELMTGKKAWVCGKVIEGTRKTIINESTNFLEV